jgi:hypothetical protein
MHGQENDLLVPVPACGRRALARGVKRNGIALIPSFSVKNVSERLCEVKENVRVLLEATLGTIQTGHPWYSGAASFFVKYKSVRCDRVSGRMVS